MKSRIRPFFQCPYCPRGRGVLALDLNKVLAQCPDPPPPPVVMPRPVPTGDKWADITAELDYMIATDTSVLNCIDPGEAGGIFVFDPGVAASGPCKHMLVFSPDVGAGSIDRETSRPIRWGWDGCWKHDWFTTHDPRESITTFIWERVIHDRDEKVSRWRPTQPHQVRSFTREWRSKRELWKVAVAPTLLVALEPLTFLDEVQRLDEALQQGSA